MAPLSNAEKQRRYRARRDSDNERRQQYLDKEKDKWKKGKCQTSVKGEYREGSGKKEEKA